MCNILSSGNIFMDSSSHIFILKIFYFDQNLSFFFFFTWEQYHIPHMMLFLKLAD